MTKRASKRFSLDYCNGFDDARYADESVTESAISDLASDYASLAVDCTGDPNGYDEAGASYMQGYREGVTRWAADKDEAYDFIIAQFDRHAANEQRERSYRELLASIKPLPEFQN